MSYLRDLISALTDEEVSRALQIKLNGREKGVFDDFIASRQNGYISDELIQQGQGLSKSHFDKLNSKILEQCLGFFAKDFNGRVNFLIDKQLYSLVIHTLNLEEKRIKGDTVALRVFYRTAFESMIRFNYNNFPEKHLNTYSRKFVALAEDNPDEKFAVLAKYEETLIRFYYYREGGVPKRAAALKRLNAYVKSIEGRNLFFAEYRLWVALSAYYNDDDPAKGLEYLIKGQKAADIISHKVDEREHAFLLVMQAYCLIRLNRFKDAREKYEDALKKFPVLVASRLYHVFNYAFVLLIVKDYRKAYAAMETYLKPFLLNPAAKNYQFDILRLYAVYHILVAEYDIAGNYLQRIMRFSKKEFTPYGDMLFRFVHNVYITQTGNNSLALDLVKKNLKFIYSKPDIEGGNECKRLFLALNQIVRSKVRNQPESAVKAIRELNLQGMSALYRLLLETAAGNAMR